MFEITVSGACNEYTDTKRVPQIKGNGFYIPDAVAEMFDDREILTVEYATETHRVRVTRMEKPEPVREVQIRHYQGYSTVWVVEGENQTGIGGSIYQSIAIMMAETSPECQGLPVVEIPF